MSVRPVTDPEINNPNPHDLTFPYPLQQSGPARAKGQGCLVCVHQKYCPAVYWFYRYTENELGPGQGTKCASWSTNPADTVTTVSQNDLDENDYIACQGIGSEARRNGITDPVTGSDGYY
jgi:hypothetical protein